MQNKKLWPYLFLIISIFSCLNIYAQDGQLDPSFDTTGIATTYYLSPDGIGWTGEAHSVVIQSNGKIIAAGFMGDGSQNFITLTRYYQNGILDSTFGTNGIVTTSIGSIDDRAYSAQIQNDGKILVAGYTTTDSYQHLFALVRYNNNGTLDSTFGKNGIVTTAIGQSDDKAFSVILQSDGKIVAAGTSYELISGLDVYSFAIARYNTDGSLDNTFGTNGIVTTTPEIANTIQQDNEAKSIKIQSDGKIVIGGYSGGGSLYYFALLRYNSNGSLDNTFGTNGISLIVIGAGDDGISSIVLQGDGKIIAGGYSQVIFQSYYTYVFALARYNSDGSLDNTFGKSGAVTTAVGQYDDAINAITLQSNGKIIAVGHTENTSQHYRFALVRYNTDGSLDNTFGTGGIDTTAINPWDDRAFAVTLQNNGKIVVAGSSQYDNFYNLSEFAVARYIGNATTGIKYLTKPNMPQAFKLYQNYPNPFNPTTVIEYSLPKQSSVVLKVYDITGREVTTLVNEKQQAGNYKVIFNSQQENTKLQLASGIYFYTLKAGNFVETKKLVLLK